MTSLVTVLNEHCWVNEIASAALPAHRYTMIMCRRSTMHRPEVCTLTHHAPSIHTQPCMYRVSLISLHPPHPSSPNLAGSTPAHEHRRLIAQYWILQHQSQVHTTPPGVPHRATSHTLVTPPHLDSSGPHQSTLASTPAKQAQRAAIHSCTQQLSLLSLKVRVYTHTHVRTPTHINHTTPH